MGQADQAPTIIERHKAQPDDTAGGTLTPDHALQVDEVARTRKFFFLLICLVLGFVPPVILVGGDDFWTVALLIGIAVTFPVCLGFLLYLRQPARYTPRRALVPILVCVLLGALGMQFCGIYSPAVAFFVFGLYFFSLSASRGASFTVLVAVIAVVAASVLLEMAGVVRDRGLVRGDGLYTREKLTLLGAALTLFVATYWFGRMSRRATLSALERWTEAREQVRQREALLLEANQDLERALAGGYRGRGTGQRVGRWQLGQVIGRGAMGEVYEATRDGDGVRAAVKLLHPEFEAEPDLMKRFAREAEALTQLDSQHVVRIHDVGSTGGTPYIAMELLEGHDLSWYLRKQRRLSPRAVVELTAQVASALERARSAGIVHRDLKPQNLFWAERGGVARVWKVLDFGVSKLGAAIGTLTMGHAVGTPGYMSPEQAKGSPVDHRADVFALAAIGYRCLTGRPAFTGDELVKVLYDTVHVQPMRPSELTFLSPDVDLVLAIGLPKDRERRFARAVELAEAHDAALDEKLPDELRRRARSLLESQPWGESLLR